MPSMNFRHLRDTRRLKAWLRAGKVVELRDRGAVVARIIPQGMPLAASEWPDFAAMRHEILKDKVLPGADVLIEERGRH